MNKKGFTLIELAIVLVIIGIILGAVIKGQDLIQNARAKKVVSKFKEWEIAQWNFYDRKGRFAGDQDADGLIGNGTNEDVKTDLTGANFINPPYEGTSGNETNTITVGSYKYYVFFGNDGSKNIMVLCKSSNCTAAFTNDDLLFLDAIDNSIDGVANGENGNVICTSSTATASTTTWVATYSALAPDNGGCTAGTSTALVYYFDSKR
jgi:prepilin-type N-terminal cleavage/methylation domain-containing protein